MREPLSDGSSIIFDVSKSANTSLRSCTRDLRMEKAALSTQLIKMLMITICTVKLMTVLRLEFGILLMLKPINKYSSGTQ